VYQTGKPGRGWVWQLGLAMPSISFDASYKRDVIEAHRVWQSGLPRRPGQLGATIASFVEAPQMGSTVTLIVEDGFVETLKASPIPFWLA
jgi:hypothetical protein